ncbi:thiolase family protein [Sphingosinicella microcystinivorans]|uniref:Acetyl-CoA acyltransferase n=1 Tax=Sphingosinicella microcystinivorans TaxID=335406 RepID=A0AAD1G2D7_SPHMI|nr:thiolase family protein [Sphingosinicella microcystinivorans]RKS86330.1 acetyl-CoA acyltransferase [Sphingosinicella microcystinivorans]BBE35624.1 acetyl-CoA acyltransferase [Sphingosinicella microcystinivorans]
MRDVVIVDAVRTPTGRFRGALKDVRADHLAAALLKALPGRTGIDVAKIDDVIFGCVTQVGEQCGNIARTALLSAGWPETIPGMTVDRKCGSAEAAIHTAFAFISSGMADIVVAGGAESMTRVPMGGNRDVHGETFGWMLNERFALTSQGEAAEVLSDRWDISRADHDDFAMESHRRAATAADAGWFDSQIVPIDIDALAEARADEPRGVFNSDETIRRDTTREKLDTLKRVFRPEDGRVSAGNASQICDGASVLLLMSAEKTAELGLRARARIRSTAVVGSDPELMLTGPIAATREALDRAGLTIADIDLFEVNEAFASVPIVWMKELGVSHDKLNVNGGAIALGHPLGASGARIMTTLLNEMERRGARYGAQAICCAGGLGTATVIERLD